MQKKISLLGKVLTLATIIVLMLTLIKVYKANNYNDYIRAEYNIGISKFSRDANVKYTNSIYSYKIENPTYNDAMFYKKIQVTKNTPYKVTCMIKTKDVQLEKENTDVGAHICINNTIEKSYNITGTTDWQKVEFLFDSKDRDEVEIGFRLGGYQGNCSGTAWFSNMTIESGIEPNNNEWNFLCIILNNVDVNVNINGMSESVKLSLNDSDIYDITTNFQRFKSSIRELSKGKIKATGEIIQIKEPLKTMSYDEENGYYVSSNDIKDILDKYIKEQKYDHIFIAFKIGNINEKNKNIVNDWIGLGGMEYRNIGYSNIRLPNEENSYIYKYNERINTFPEEVFVHEFLHTLERVSDEYGYDRPELHDNEKYNYISKPLVSLKQWYMDYINCEIKTSNGNIGLPEEIFFKKPINESNFTYSHKLKYFNEPSNIIEEIKNFINRFI